jgi:hypothetical protein
MDELIVCLAWANHSAGGSRFIARIAAEATFQGAVVTPTIGPSGTSSSSRDNSGA